LKNKEAADLIRELIETELIDRSIKKTNKNKSVRDKFENSHDF